MSGQSEPSFDRQSGALPPPLALRARLPHFDRHDRFVPAGPPLVLDHRDMEWVLVRPSPSHGERAGNSVPGTLPGTSITFAALAEIVMARYYRYQSFDEQAAAIAGCGMPAVRKTLAGWLDAASASLAVVAEEIRTTALTAPVLSAANVSVTGSKREGARFWAYVVDCSQWQSGAISLVPRMVWYRFTLKRTGLHAVNELAGYTGVVQAAVHAGYHRLLATAEQHSAGCWEEIRQRAIGILRCQGVSGVAAALVGHVDALQAIERSLADTSAMERQSARSMRSLPILDHIRSDVNDAHRTADKHSDTGKLVADLIDHWPMFERFAHDGRIELDSSHARDALDLISGGRHNWVIGHRRRSGERAATIYTVTETCKRNGVDPGDYIAWVLPRLLVDRADLPLSALMPWCWRASVSG